jgi:hypothetical protein
VGFLSDLVSRKKISEQGQTLARQFAKRLTKERAGDEKRVKAEYEILVGDAVGYQRRAQLGVLGKSALVNSFQWALVAEGFSEDFAKELGGQLAVTLAATV